MIIEDDVIRLLEENPERDVYKSVRNGWRITYASISEAIPERIIQGLVKNGLLRRKYNDLPSPLVLVTDPAPGQ